MVRIKNTKNLNAELLITLKQSISDLNAFLKALPNLLDAYEEFTYTTYKGYEVIKVLQKDKDINLTGYKSKWPWSKVKAYTIPSNDDSIWLNTRNKFNSSFLTGVIAHELCHLLGFGHGDNSPNHSGYKESVPEVIQDLAEKYSEALNYKIRTNEWK